MKQNAHVKLSVLGLLVLGIFLVNCGKPARLSGDKVAEEFINLINKRIPGTQFHVKPGNCLVEPVGNNRYRITLKNSSFTSDFSRIIKFIDEDYSPSNENARPLPDTARVEEVVVIYGPEEEYTDVLSMKGLSMDFDYSKMEGEGAFKIGDFKVNKIHASVGNITRGDLNTSDLLHSGKENPHLLDTTVENIKLELSGITKKKENQTILLEIEKIRHFDEGNQDCLSYILIKDAPPPDLTKILQEGSAVIDFNPEFGKVKISIKKNGAKWGGGTLDSISIPWFLKPDETGNSFKFGIGFGIKNLELAIPGKKEIALLSNIKEFRFEISIEHLKPGAVLAILDYMKKIIQMSDLADNAKAQEIVLKGITLWAELVKSKPLVKLSIAPFKHYFGEMEVKANARVHGLFSPPDSKISITLFKIDETLKKLKEANVLSSAQLKEISGSLEKYAVKQESGDAAITIEQKPDQPGIVYVNGSPIKTF